MTALEIIIGINAYPIPQATVVGIATKRGLDMEAQASHALLSSAEFNLAKSDVLMWLADAPNISQGGQSYSFSEEQRKEFKMQANALRAEYDTETPKAKYGYKGTRL